MQPEGDEGKYTQINPTALHCFKCNTRGHKAVNCPTIAKKCFLFGKHKDTKLETVVQVDEGSQEDNITRNSGVSTLLMWGEAPLIWLASW